MYYQKIERNKCLFVLFYKPVNFIILTEVVIKSGINEVLDVGVSKVGVDRRYVLATVESVADKTNGIKLVSSLKTSSIFSPPQCYLIKAHKRSAAFSLTGVCAHLPPGADLRVVEIPVVQTFLCKLLPKFCLTLLIADQWQIHLEEGGVINFNWHLSLLLEPLAPGSDPAPGARRELAGARKTGRVDV